MSKLKNKKGFTLIELIVTIAVLGILVLIGGPKLLGYLEKAELTKIQHDVKVAENKMAEVLNDENDFVSWANNEKDLGALILRNQLYEKQGVAKNVELIQPTTKTARINNNELGTGGLLNEITSDNTSGYKVVPANLVKQIGTKLKGTFYSNRLGKVYYEPNKPLKSIKQENILNCVTAESLGYKFEIVNGKGTITGYNGNLTHLYIPSAFLIDGECVPVKVIAAGAFKNGNFTKITIPQSVKEIQPDAFKDGQLTEVEIPHSVTVIGSGAFAGNPIKTGGITVNAPADSVNTGSGAFGTVTPTYKTPTSNDLNIVVATKVNSKGVKTGSIKGYYGTNSSGSTGSGSTGGSGGSGSNSGSGSTEGLVGSGNYLNNVVSIPSKVVVNGETIVITEVAKGAYQGKGVIYVEFPDSLEIIEDYAFAGNQLIGVELPPNVKSVGNYAFAYNEIDGKRTLGYVKIPATNDYLNKINNVGNIEIEGTKANKIGNASLLEHVFVFGNDFDIPETYNPIKNDVVEEDESGKDGVYSEEEIAELVASGYKEVKTAEDLNNVRNNLSGKYIQTKDIDLSAYSSGEGWEPIGNQTNNFLGTYDGGGFEITGLTINRPSEYYIGLFGYLNKYSLIENVSLKSVNITGFSHVGGLVGYNYNSSTVSNSNSTGSINGSSLVGGLVGYNHYSKVLKSYSTGSVNSLNARVKIGGLVGANYGSTVSESYSTSNVNGKSSVGGLVGESDFYSNILDSYSTGKIIGEIRTSGLVGSSVGDSNIKRSYSISNIESSADLASGIVGYASLIVLKSYYNIEKVGPIIPSNGLSGTPKTTFEMKKKTTYSDWNFDTIWQIEEGVSYPTLKWQK